MNSEDWIHTISRAIDVAGDWDVYDEDSELTFSYDTEVLLDIQTSLEAGATSDEIEHQFDDYVHGNFSRYIETLAAALDQNDESGDNEEPTESEQGIETESTVSDQDVPTLKNQDLGATDLSEEDGEPAPKKANKKKTVIVSAAAFLVVMLGSAVWLGYAILSGPQTSNTQAKVVHPILNTNPKPAPLNQGGSKTEGLGSTHSAQPIAQGEHFSVAQMDSGQSHSDPRQTNDNPQPEPSIANVRKSSGEVRSTEISEIKLELTSKISELETLVKSEMGDKLAPIHRSIDDLAGRLDKIDQIEKQITSKEKKSEREAEYLNKRLSGLTRLGEFSILATTGLSNRVVALSPTNRVITLEEGEQDVYAAGSRLTVKEIIGDGKAVIFSNGWFIDDVRAPDSLREKKLTAEAAKSHNDATDEPAVPNTAKYADSPSPAQVASRLNATGHAKQANVDRQASPNERFPTIKRAPQGWSATALIPPRKAVITTPDGESLTITTGADIAGLGKVHSVKYDRVLAGQYYIPLSNM